MNVSGTGTSSQELGAASGNRGLSQREDGRWSSAGSVSGPKTYTCKSVRCSPREPRPWNQQLGKAPGRRSQVSVWIRAGAWARRAFQTGAWSPDALPAPTRRSRSQRIRGRQAAQVWWAHPAHRARSARKQAVWLLGCMVGRAVRDSGSPAAFFVLHTSLLLSLSRLWLPRNLGGRLAR